LTVTPSVPSTNLTGQTIIITGANTGLGLFASKHIARLGCTKLILACRSLPKGEEAKTSILQYAKRSHEPECIEVWPLDLCSYDSVVSFADRCNMELDRIDAVLENAGVSTETYRRAEDNELTVTTNVMSTFLLAILMLPKLRDSARKHDIVPRLTIVGSEVHSFASFKERSSQDIFGVLNDEKTAKMKERYFLSKLLVMLAFREMAARMSETVKKGGDMVILNTVAPGWCYSDLFRDDPNFGGLGMTIAMKIFARSTDEGSRCLVGAVVAGKESHGEYLNDCKIKS
jgi:retinol dehydrogenase-12